jgi:hypothetical protein
VQTVRKRERLRERGVKRLREKEGLIAGDVDEHRLSIHGNGGGRKQRENSEGKRRKVGVLICNDLGKIIQSISVIFSPKCKFDSLRVN